jgi:O-antigen/teichoic acid export membrane protein
LSLSFTASATVQILNVLTGILLARALGPSGRGELTAVLLWPLALSIVGSLGVSEAATYYAARGRASTGTLLGTTMAVGLLQSLVLAVLGFVILPFVLSGHGAGMINSARLFLAVIPLSLVTLSLMGLLNGLQRFAAFHCLRVLVIGGTAAGLIGVQAIGHLTVRAAVLVYLAANLVTFLAAYWVVVNRAARPMRVERALVRDLLTFGVKSHSSNVPSMLNERLDQLVISMFLAPVRLGLYAVAVTMTSVTNLIGASVSYVALPAVARLAPGEERTSAARRFIVLTVLLSAAFTVPVILFARPLIEMLFGGAFAGSVNVSRVLLVGAVVLSTTRAIGAILKAVNRPLDAGIAETIALGVTILALAVLLPALGIMGAAIASLLAYGVSCAFSLRQASRALEIESHRLVRPTRADLRYTA